MSNNEPSSLAASPMKRRRGRPALKKKSSGNVIGESTIPIEVASTHHQSAHELSQAAEKQGFCSTPVMRLSPSKDLSKSSKSKANSQLISNFKSKSILSDFNSTNINHQTTNKKLYSELCFVNSKSGSTNTKSKNLLSQELSPKRTLKFNTNPSTLSSSSPLSSNIMSNDAINNSSPLQTSPIPSESNININTSNHNKTLKRETKPTFSLQSSPLYIHHQNTSRSDTLDDQLFKYINSSPIHINNSPKSLRNRENEYNLDNLMKLQRNNNYMKIKKHNFPPTPTSKTSSYAKNFTNRLNYKYKLTLDIDDYGKAKIYARVIENNIYPMFQSRFYDKDKFLHGNIEDDYETDLIFSKDEEYKRKCDRDTDIDAYIPSRYEQYIDEQIKSNEQRQRLIKSSMKSDPYMTDYYTPNEYTISATNSPLQMRTLTPASYYRPGTNNNNILYSQPEFEEYINQEYEKVKTVNLNNIMNNNKGLSAGIDFDSVGTLNTYEYGVNKPHLLKKINLDDSDEDEGVDELKHYNDALLALRDATLN